MGSQAATAGWSFSRRSIRYLQHPPRKTPSVSPEWCIETGRHATSVMRSTSELQALLLDLTGFEPATTRLQVEVTEIFSTRFDIPTGNRRQRHVFQRMIEVSAIFTTIGDMTIHKDHGRVNSKRKLFRHRHISFLLYELSAPLLRSLLPGWLTASFYISRLSRR